MVIFFHNKLLSQLVIYDFTSCKFYNKYWQKQCYKKYWQNFKLSSKYTQIEALKFIVINRKITLQRFSRDRKVKNDQERLIKGKGDVLKSWTNLRGTSRSSKFTETEQQFNRTSSNGFKLPEGGFKLDIRKQPFTMRLVKHRHAAQRNGGCAIPGNIQDYFGQSSEQPHPAEDVLAHCMGMVLKDLPSNPSISVSLWFPHVFRDIHVT